MAWNTYQRLLGLIPSQRTDVGEVVAVHGDGCTVPSMPAA